MTNIGVSSAVLANITMTGSLPYNFPANMTPMMGTRNISNIMQGVYKIQP